MPLWAPMETVQEYFHISSPEEDEWLLLTWAEQMRTIWSKITSKGSLHILERAMVVPGRRRECLYSQIRCDPRTVHLSGSPQLKPQRLLEGEDVAESWLFMRSWGCAAGGGGLLRSDWVGSSYEIRFASTEDVNHDWETVFGFVL